MPENHRSVAELKLLKQDSDYLQPVQQLVRGFEVVRFACPLVIDGSVYHYERAITCCSSITRDAVIERSRDMDTSWLYRFAFTLSVLTIASSLLEAGFSLYFGFADETLTLFGFGVDSLIETLSAVGIAHMITRIQRNDNEVRDEFEKLALRITGVSFLVLAFGLVISAVATAVTKHHPETTISGIIISLLSIVAMLGLMVAKLRVGKDLNSRPIIADANCTKVCIYMSVTLLLASLIYHLTGIGYVDALGSMIIAYFSYSEGKECLHKSK